MDSVNKSTLQLIQIGLASLIFASSTVTYVADAVKPPEGVLYAPFQIPTVEAFYEKPIIWTPKYVQERITYWAQYFDYPVERALAIAQCESGLNHKAIGDSGKAYGTFQFWESTFYGFAQDYSSSTKNYKDPEHNIEVALWALSHGKESHWSCFYKI